MQDKGLTDEEIARLRNQCVRRWNGRGEDVLHEAIVMALASETFDPKHGGLASYVYGCLRIANATLLLKEGYRYGPEGYVREEILESDLICEDESGAEYSCLNLVENVPWPDRIIRKEKRRKQHE